MRIRGCIADAEETSLGKDRAEIELTPLELLEQLTNVEVGELLDLINIPQKPEKECMCGVKIGSQWHKLESGRWVNLQEDKYKMYVDGAPTPKAGVVE